MEKRAANSALNSLTKLNGMRYILWKRQDWRMGSEKPKSGTFSKGGEIPILPVDLEYVSRLEDSPQLL
jgi:hypothetical protein